MHIRFMLRPQLNSLLSVIHHFLNGWFDTNTTQVGTYTKKECNSMKKYFVQLSVAIIYKNIHSEYTIVTLPVYIEIKL